MEEVARPFRVCLIGAESTGKTELAQELARHFGAPWVAEYSRTYATAVNRELSYMDVSPIAQGQIDLEGAASATDLLILDTDLLSTVVYSRHHFGSCPTWIEGGARSRRADLYLLLDIDVQWVPDPVRDSGDTRVELHQEFQRVLEQFGVEVVRISGTWDQRFHQAVAAITERQKAEGRRQK